MGYVIDLATARQRVAAQLTAELRHTLGAAATDIHACDGDWAELRNLKDRLIRDLMGAPAPGGAA